MKKNKRLYSLFSNFDDDERLKILILSKIVSIVLCLPSRCLVLVY